MRSTGDCPGFRFLINRTKTGFTAAASVPVYARTPSNSKEKPKKPEGINRPDGKDGDGLDLPDATAAGINRPDMLPAIWVRWGGLILLARDSLASSRTGPHTHSNRTAAALNRRRRKKSTYAYGLNTTLNAPSCFFWKIS